jgi:RNA polymerase sigma-70 factor (sigma-E family)
MDAADQPRLELFVLTRTPALLRAAYLLTGDQATAEDLVQAALVKVAPRWSRVIAGGDPEAYVRTILYREHVSAWRRHRGREVLTDDGTLPDARVSGPTDADIVVQRVSLAALLDQLPRRQRAVVVLRYYEDLSETAAALVLGCSVGTIRSQTAKALARLRVLAPVLEDSIVGRPPSAEEEGA